MKNAMQVVNHEVRHVGADSVVVDVRAIHNALSVPGAVEVARPEHRVAIRGVGAVDPVQFLFDVVDGQAVRVHNVDLRKQKVNN
jgi:hypothetical protein